MQWERLPAGKLQRHRGTISSAIPPEGLNSRLIVDVDETVNRSMATWVRVCTCSPPSV
jgi:hypothetical protein